MQKLWLVSFIGMLLLGVGAPDGAAAQEDIVYKYVRCDVEYVIQPGDTLESISRTAYG